METKVSEEINQFQRKNKPQKLVFARVHYLGFGAPIDIFVNGYIYIPLISHCKVKLSDTER